MDKINHHVLKHRFKRDKEANQLYKQVKAQLLAYQDLKLKVDKYKVKQ